MMKKFNKKDVEQLKKEIFMVLFEKYLEHDDAERSTDEILSHLRGETV
jgi:hypothetical protein